MTEEKRICSKCDKIIKDDHKFCPSCGGKVVNKEEHRVKGVKKRKLWLYFVIPIVLILIIGSIVIFAIPFPDVDTHLLLFLSTKMMLFQARAKSVLLP